MDMLTAIAWIGILTLQEHSSAHNIVLQPYEPAHISVPLLENDPTTLIATGGTGTHLDCYLLGLKDQTVAWGEKKLDGAQCIIKITATTPGKYTWVVINAGKDPESVSLEIK
jgi:hypothetical protein